MTTDANRQVAADGPPGPSPRGSAVAGGGRAGGPANEASATAALDGDDHAQDVGTLRVQRAPS